MSIHPENLEQLFEGKIQRRWTETKPNATLEALILKNTAHYASVLRDFMRYTEALSRIPVAAPQNAPLPHWQNTWLSGLDAASLYGFAARNEPATYLEIGSGNSTMFVHRAIFDRQLDTRIISIDPAPRAEIDALCDQVIRRRLEETDWQPLIKKLIPGDIVFFDGSHRCYENSDVTVFFNEVLPAIPAGVLIGIHDIFLPADYPEHWSRRYYSEQYLLACWLLADAGRGIRIELPVRWLTMCRPSADVDNLFSRLPVGIQKHGGAFWISKTE